MSQRILRTLSIIACGCSMQLFGCESKQISEIVIGNVRDTIVDVSTFLIGSAVDTALGLEDQE